MSGVGIGYRNQQLGSAGVLDAKRHNRGELVEVASNMDKDGITTGGIRLTQFVTEKPQSINFVVDSNDRTHGTPFNFVVDMQSNLFRSRLITVKRVIIPKVYNMTVRNNVINWYITILPSANTMSPRLTTILTPGFYDTTTLANELATKMTATLFALYPLDLYNMICSFDPSTNEFNLTLDDSLAVAEAGTMRTWYMVDSSPFILRGINLAPFPSLPDAGVVQPVLATNTIQSGPAGMVYTRFVSLHSDALNQYAYAETKVSKASPTGGSMVAVFNTAANNINANIFAGTFIPYADEAPNLSTLNPQKQLQKNLDFRVYDEYGDDLGSLFPSDNKLGVSLWLEISF